MAFIIRALHKAFSVYPTSAGTDDFGSQGFPMPLLHSSALHFLSSSTEASAKEDFLISAISSISPTFTTSQQ
jgi:hypothetical protein